MKKQFKRVLCTVLTVALLASTAVTAFAAGGDKFTDVKADSWYKPYVDFVVEHNYFKGTSDTTFSPLDAMTRAMFVTVIARMENVQLNDNATTSFSDVSSGTWYTGAVAWAADKAIINGTGNGQFSPTQSITRQEMAVIMQRYVEYVQNHSNKIHKTPNPNITFVDADQIASWATDAVKQCVYWGLIIGNEKNEFMPTKNATRAEVSAVIYRLAWLIMGGGGGGGKGGSSTPIYEIGASIKTSDATRSSWNLNPTVQVSGNTTVGDAIDQTYSQAKTQIINAITKAVTEYAEHYANATASAAKDYQAIVTRYENGIKADKDQLKADMPNAAAGIEALYVALNPANFFNADGSAIGVTYKDDGTVDTASVETQAQAIYDNNVKAVKDAVKDIIDGAAKDGSAAVVPALQWAQGQVSVASFDVAPDWAQVTKAVDALKTSGINTTVQDFYTAMGGDQDVSGSYTLTPGTLGYNYLANALGFGASGYVQATVTLSQSK